MIITSSSNSRIKLLRQLIREGQSDSENRIPVEGIKLVQEALKSDLLIEAIYVAQDKMKDISIRDILKQVTRHRPEVTLVSDRVFASMVGTENPQGIVALVKLTQTQWGDVINNSPLVLVACQLQDPGNLGTVFRSAEAFGIKGILLTQNTVSPMNQKVIRASAGSLFRIHHLSGLEPEKLIGDLNRLGFRLIAATSKGDMDFRQADYRGPTALIVGNEGRGLPDGMLDRVPLKVKIPLAPQVESLNVAIASSIILCEAARQRGVPIAECGIERPS
jgi:RNA methyltransferase, TrmH family